MRYTYRIVNDLPGMCGPVDRIEVACSDLRLLLSRTSPFLLDVPELVVWMQH